MMNNKEYRIKGLQYDVDVNESTFRLLQLVFHEPADFDFSFENVKYDKHKLLEVYEQWKQFSPNEPDQEIHKLQLGEDAYVTFHIEDDFEGNLSIVLDEQVGMKFDVPVFFMEFESFVQGIGYQ